jgi:hypothetical protein
MQPIKDGLDPADDELWGTGDMAAAWALNREYVTDVLTKRHDFPKPVVNFSRRIRKWQRVAVEAYRVKALSRG